MKLKKTIYLTIALLGMNILSGCSDWLDYTPKDQQTEDQQFSTREGFYAAVNGVYNSLNSTTLYGKNLSYGALDCMAQRYYTGANQSRYEYMWSQYNYTKDELSGVISSIWSGTYGIILNTNVILDNLEKKKEILTEQDYHVIKGDLLALRAFLHLDMLRLFGPVYSRHPEEEAIPYNDSREAKAYELLPAKTVIYDHILPDLKEAERVLQLSDPVLTEGALNSDAEVGSNYLRYRQLRLNYYAVILLKARTYLWAGDVTNAATEARRITDDAQMKTYFPFVAPDKLLGNNTDPDRVFSTESLFGIYNSQRGTIYTSLFDGANLSSTTLLQPYASYLLSQLFTNQGDYRYMSQWTASGYFIKYKDITLKEEDQKNPPFYTYFMPLMHLSEAYYIAAEALSTTDPIAATGYLNTILKARGTTQLETDAKADRIMTEVKKEYMRETWGEGQIFYLFKRLYTTISGIYNASATTGVVNASDAVYKLPLPTSEQTNR